LNNFKDEPPKTLAVEEGIPFGIKCHAPDGWPKPNVYWMLQGQNWLKTINSSRLTVDPNGQLWFSNVTKDDSSDDFLYACSAASYFRNEYKLGNRVHLHVIPEESSRRNRVAPGLQYVSPKDEVAFRGKELRLWCIFGGTPLPKIRWTKTGGALPWERVSYDNYGKTLVIKHVDFEDAGEYSCEASNGVGLHKSHSIRLEVQAKPRFKVEPELQNAAEGEEIVFECQADGFPVPDIDWSQNGMPIKDAPYHPSRIVSKDKIIITNLKNTDTANYGCNATNTIGYVYKDVYINVLALPPEILNAPAKQSRTVEGNAITLDCKTFGAPKPLVKWYHGNTELFAAGRYTSKPDGDLVIKEVKFSDVGKYTCTATNKFGQQSASGSLVIKEKTRIITGPRDYEAEAGSTATFRCHAEHDPDLSMKIRWFKDGEYLDVNLMARFVQSSDQSLAITKTTELDSGQFTCMAETDLDYVEASAKLIVQDVPNPPILKWVDCAAKDATVVWQPMGENKAPILTYKIQYNTTFEPGHWETATGLLF
jgi:neuronal cell adhesion protein